MFKAGFSRVDITPPLGSPLAGYFKPRYAESVLDPLELNALAASDGENTVVMIIGDLLYVMEKAATEIRNKVSVATGLPVENILIQGLHQHTSMRIGSRATGMIASMEDEAYLDILNRKYCDVAKMAIEDMCEATVGVAVKETQRPVSFIRRYRMKDGSSRTNPGWQNPDVKEPIGKADNNVRLIRFFRKDAKDIALVNFSTHPDTVGGSKISADWPGFVRRMTEKDIENVNCIVMNGCQGDTNHVDISKAGIDKDRYEFCRDIGRVITDAVVDIWDKTEQKRPFPISSVVEMKYIPTNTKHIEKVEEFKKIKEKYDAGLLPDMELSDKAELLRVCELYDEKLFQKVPVSAIGMGEIGFVGFGGEPFTEYSYNIRKAVPDMFLIVACLVNGGEGYLPTKEAFDEGGYEAKNSRFTASVQETLESTAKNMIQQHKNRI